MTIKAKTSCGKFYVNTGVPCMRACLSEKPKIILCDGCQSFADSKESANTLKSKWKPKCKQFANPADSANNCQNCNRDYTKHTVFQTIWPYQYTQ